MSKEFRDRLARGELTTVEEYQRMKKALQEMKAEDNASAPQNDEWQNWELSPVWSASDSDATVADDSIRADSVHRALKRMSK